MSAVEPSRLARSTVEGLLRAARELSETDDLPTMLSIFARALSDVADFECAAINLVRDDGDLQVLAVAGPPDVAEALMGVVGSRADWDAELAGGQRVGAVQLMLGEEVEGSLRAWVSDDEAWFERTSDDPRAWRANYAVYVPIHEADGSLLGVISVDLPRSGRIPDQRQCEILEIIVRQAESAILAVRERARSELDEHILGSVFEIGHAPMCVADQDGRFTQANRRFRESFGEVAGIEAFGAMLPAVEGAESLQSEVAEIFAGRAEESTFVAGAKTSEGWRCFHVALRGAAYSTTTPSRIVCTLTDISAERRARELLRHDAEHDQLTGLLNRRGMRAAAAGIVENLDAAEVVAALYLDLDGFKQANDLHGHRFGDRLMMEVASLLRDAVPPGVVVGRAGGDEFVIAAGCATADDAMAIADAVVAAIDLAVPGSDSRVTTSVGLAISAAGAGVHVPRLFHTADQGLYAAKLAGGARWMLAED